MRVTEQNNPLTERLDRVPPLQMLQLLSLAEHELFGSTSWGPALLDPPLLRQLAQLRERIATVLAAGGQLVLGGAGTSGRLALQTATLAPGTAIHGLLAGGVEAFLAAREGVEDSAAAGSADLKAVLHDGPLVYIGISCGLSAAYVAGQLDLALKREDSTAVALGFNAFEDASTRPLAELGQSFAQVVERLRHAPQGLLLNPILGPEGVSGSTRLKGGSATRLILDYLCAKEPDASAWFNAARDLHQTLHDHLDQLVPILKQAQAALQSGQNLTYVAEGRAGLMALLDASEIPPTFGASPDQVSCLVQAHLTDTRALLPLAAVSPNLLHGPRPAEQLIAIGAAGLNLIPPEKRGAALRLTLPQACIDQIARLPQSSRASFTDLTWKWWLNLLSTGTYVGHGKVYGNRMIDLRISNIKLWERARNIVAELAQTSEATADAALLAAIPGTKPNQDLATRVGLAVKTQRVIPTAVLIAQQGLKASEARASLEAAPKLSEALHKEKS